MDYKVFWCKVNKFYLNKWLNFFKENWYKENSVLVTTCVVTDNAKKKWVKELKKLVETKEKLYITWCWVLKKWKKMEEKEFYSIYPELSDIKNKIELLEEEPEIATSWDFSDEIYTTRKYVIIQNWCDSKCTFCLTIEKRGAHRSRKSEEIIEEINTFYKNWWKEIIITWINLAAWWCINTKNSEESKFSYLLEDILEKTKIPRIRISSIWPEFLDDKFFEIIENKRFLPHFHFSIQSFSKNVLKKMNRNYDDKRLEYVLNRIKNLERAKYENVWIWADIIVWFPWETEEDFQESLNWVENFKITKLHAFPFSAHLKWETVPASAFQQVSFEIKKEREWKILKLWREIRENFIKENKWKKHLVLVEKQNKWKISWWTWNYINFEFPEWTKSWEILEVVL